MLEEFDKKLMNARDKTVYRHKGKEKTTVKAKTGLVEYTRTKYITKNEDGTNKCVYLIDELLNIKEIENLLGEAEAKAEHIKELENKVSEMPSQLEKEYARGRKEAIAEIEKEHKYTTELLKKDYENTIDRQKDKIESLQEEIAKANTEKAEMQDKLDQAYNQIKEMATKTVEATGGVKILGNNGTDLKS